MAETPALATAVPRLDPRRLPGAHGIALLVGIAASVAVGVGVVLWTQRPDFQLLYGSLSDRDQGAIVQGLEGAGIPYRISGDAVMVPADKVDEARLKLASQGLPQSASMGLEMVQEDKGFGTSQFMENARYQHALETELARTIATLQPVRSARVHLAMSRPSALLRNRTPGSASVLVNLYPGRHLDQEQISAITHMVASSIPDLEASRVTLIDQSGKLLSAPGNGNALDRTDAQFDAVRRVEEAYQQRIVGLLEPLTGPGRVRAEVSASMDFTEAEEVSESYGADKTALRSEQTAEEVRRSGADALGIPGALSNQPPVDAASATVAQATAPAAAAASAPANQAGPDVTTSATEPTSESRRATRNYEIDRTLSRKRPGIGTLSRLSVAVLVDSKPAGQDAAAPTAEDIERMTTLVKQAIGYNEQRGDSVSVITAAFQIPAGEGTTGGVPVWRNPALFGVLKQLLGVALVALIVFTVLRPVARRLALPPPPVADLVGGRPGALAGSAPLLQGMNPEQQIAAARNLVGQDPRRVAQTMRRWLDGDG